MTERQGETLVEQLERELGVFAGTALGLEMLEHLDKFVKDEDFNWVDLMVWRLTSEGLPLPTTIQVLAARVAWRRLHGVGSRNDTSGVMKEHAKDVARAFTMFLRGTGLSKAKATKHATNATHAVLGFAYKASTLDAGLKAYIDERSEAELLGGVGRAWADLYPEQHAETVSELDAVPKRDPGTRR